MQRGSRDLDKEQSNKQLNQQVLGFYSSKIVSAQFEEMIYMEDSP
jgi:hypothetical protein